MEGQNQLLFTYGATSAGKTWTMQGDMGNSGIIPRSLVTVFNTIGSQISNTDPVQPVASTGGWVLAKGSWTRRGRIRRPSSDWAWTSTRRPEEAV